MSKESIDHVKKVTEQVNEGGKSLADLMTKTCLGLEETLRYRFPISSELKAYYEGIEKGIDIPTLITKIKNDNNLGSGTLSNLNGTLIEQLNYYNTQITQKQNTLQTAQQAYDSYNYSGIGNNQSTTFVNVITQAQNSLNNSVSSRDRVKIEIDKVKSIIAPLQDFDTNGNLVGIATSRKSEITGIKNTFNKFSINNTSGFVHNTIDQNNVTINSVDLGTQIFSNTIGAGQSYVFYDEQSQKETKSNNKDGTVSTSVLLKDGSYREVKIKGLYIDIITKKVIFDKIQVEGVDEADYPIQIRSLNIRGVLQDGGREYYMDKQLSLTINQGVGTVNKKYILSNQAFTTELNNRMAISHQEHIVDIDHDDSQIYQTVRGHLDKHPDFARLANNQKEELYHKVLGLKQVHTSHMSGTPPVSTPITRDIFGGAELGAAINATQARDTIVRPPAITPSMSGHNLLFADYVEGKDVEPKPTPEDIKDEVSYRKWLSRNLTVLTKNYIGHRLAHYLGTSDVTQAINDTITQYVTSYDQAIINTKTHLVPNINTAVTALRGCLPYGKNNKARTTLMTGRTAQIKDTVTYRKDTFSYTTDVVFSNAPAISATLQLNNADPITLHGRTPGDLLAKILTGGGARIDGQRERLHMAFGTMKAIIKANPAYAAGLSVPINTANNGVGETNGPELRITLDSNDKIKVQRMDFDATRNEMVPSPGAGDLFDEANPHDKERLTHDFIINLNSAMNRIMDNQYRSYKDTISSAKNPLRTMSNRLGLSRERMSYKTQPRMLRGLLTKWINRKQPGVEAFAFPVTVGNQTMNIDYQPNGTITLESNGKTRKGKNLAKLLNPTSMSIFGGIFANKKNFTDGFEIPVMQGLYDGLSRQLMQNERVNQYTYLVRDPVTKIVYTMHSDPNGEPQIGIIENVTGIHDRTRDMLMMSRQKRGRTKGIPPQGIRQLNEAEKQAILGRPDIMDGFMQTMIKAREEIVRIPTSGYRSLSLNVLGLGTVATAGAGLATLGGINLASGGLLSSSLYSAGSATNSFVTGTAPTTMWTVTKNTATAVGNTLVAGTKVIAAPLKGVLGAAA